MHQSQLGACERHLRTASRLFEDDGIDIGPVREAWTEMRRQFRFATPASSTNPVGCSHVPMASPHRAALAVMPFVAQGEAAAVMGGLADGLTHDIITRLAKLRDLFVIARGSVFALAQQGLPPEQMGQSLNVDYIASGTVRRQAGRIWVTVELVETQSARVIWADSFDLKQDETFSVLDEIGNKIVSSITSEIETVERNRAVLKPPNSLDAWEAYHRGLWHMYQFTRPDNELAQHFFQMAIRLDPTFARAYAGMSFTHWQNAFQRWADRETESARAFEAASRSLVVDDQNPAAHWAMGRAMWLNGQQDQSLAALETAVDLSPNFALGHYALSFVHAQSGDPAAAIQLSDRSRLLSPLDPLRLACWVPGPWHMPGLVSTTKRRNGPSRQRRVPMHTPISWQ